MGHTRAASSWGGGVTPENACLYLDAGASHVIVTSYVFRDGQIQYDNLKKMRNTVGKDRLVLDLSCRKKNGKKRRSVLRGHGPLAEMDRGAGDAELLTGLSADCDEFLIHAVDVEGKASGVERELIRMLGDWEGIPVTYAGGVEAWRIWRR